MDHDKGIRFLRIRKIVTLAQLVLHLRCSPRTVQRRLAEWEGINSYNRNGSYYTLPDIAEFDVDGLWQYQGALFSRFGNLPETFTCLVANSKAGLTAAEAGALMGLRPSSFLWSLREHPALRREKHQGVYVYLSSDDALYCRQMQQRSLMPEAARMPADFEAVAILAEKIKHPALTNEELSRRLRRQGLSVAPETIENLFVRHGLTAVKKTPHSI